MLLCEIIQASFHSRFHIGGNLLAYKQKLLTVFHNNIIHIIHCFKGNIYQYVWPEIPENPQDVIVLGRKDGAKYFASGGFLGTEGQKYWYISPEAMK